MAIDSKQKRMSAIHISSPWRGAMVDAAESGFNQGNRQAAAFMYSGISAAPPPASGSVPSTFFTLGIVREMGFNSSLDNSIGF